MIQIRIVTNTWRKTIATDENNTIRDVLEANEVNYEIAPVYIDGAPFTRKMIPCGGLEEVDEIMEAVGDNREKDFFAINLIGHGCIVMANNVNQLREIQYVSREMPEVLL